MNDYQGGPVTVHIGEAREVLCQLADESIHCVVSSPPYLWVRDYRTAPARWADGWLGELGQEQTPELYVQHVVEVFREARRVLRRDGNLFLNVSDTRSTDRQWFGVPHRVALGLQADGWRWEDEVVWNKPNAVPSSGDNRTTRAHEMLFVLNRGRAAFYNAEAVREPLAAGSAERMAQPYRDRYAQAADNKGYRGPFGGTSNGSHPANPDGRNCRSVWTIATQPYAEAHFATMPDEVARRCIAAGSPEGGTVLDPFAGSGTTLAVARRLGRRAVGVELQANYLPLIRQRVEGAALPLLETQ